MLSFRLDKPINVLIVEDSELIISLIKNELNSLEIDVLIVEALTGLEADQLINNEPFEFDIILLDYSLPQKSGLEILIRIREISKDVQVILTTGMGSEKVAADALRLGANDYIIKEENFIPKLAKAFVNAMEKRQLQKILQQKEEELRLSELKYRTLINQANDGIIIINSDNKIEEVNEQLLSIVGRKEEELISQNWQVIFTGTEKERIARLFYSGKFIDTTIKKSEVEIFVEISVKAVNIQEDEEFVIMILRDVTENKRLENILKEQTERLETKLSDIRQNK